MLLKKTYNRFLSDIDLKVVTRLDKFFLIRKENSCSPDEVFLTDSRIERKRKIKIPLFKIGNRYIIDPDDNNKRYRIYSI